MHVDLIGVPCDFGAGRRGVDMGPSALRYAELTPRLQELGHVVHDRGNILVPITEPSQDVSEPKLRYLEPILAVIRLLGDATAASLSDGHFPLVLGGDHSLALGSIRGAARHKRLGVIWIDAHGDFNTTETTPSGNIHGMPLAALAGYGDSRLVEFDGRPGGAVEPAKIALIGARDLDPGERRLLHEAGVQVFAMEKIDCVGLYQVMQEAIAAISQDTDALYLSLDLDSLDPLYAPGVGTPVQGGLTYREAHMACELVAETGKLVGMDLVEVNPILDHRNQTAELAVELALSALGKRIWNY